MSLRGPALFTEEQPCSPVSKADLDDKGLCCSSEKKILEELLMLTRLKWLTKEFPKSLNSRSGPSRRLCANVEHFQSKEYQLLEVEFLSPDTDCPSRTRHAFSRHRDQKREKKKQSRKSFKTSTSYEKLRSIRSSQDPDTGPLIHHLSASYSGIPNFPNCSLAHNKSFRTLFIWTEICKIKTLLKCMKMCSEYVFYIPLPQIGDLFT